LASVKDYSRRFAKQMDKTTEIGASDVAEIEHAC
jgi:hypothetical protein